MIRFTVSRREHRALGSLLRLEAPGLRLDFTPAEAAAVSRALLAVLEGRSQETEIYLSPIASDCAFAATVEKDGLTLAGAGNLNWPAVGHLVRSLAASDQIPVPNSDTDIRAYHQLSKHAFNRYAPSPDYLDWDAQPNPFRSFDGARRIALPLRLDAGGPPFAEMDAATTAPPLDADALGLFFELALGLSAWKEIPGGDRWALRNNPSSGNLHPTEGWALLPALAGVGVSPALYHYNPWAHALEERRLLARLPELPEGGFLVALSSIPWREAWKYGERAFRYCQHDVGHALASAAMAAACLGWKLRTLAAPGDTFIADLLGLSRQDARHLGEREHPDLLALVAPGDREIDPATVDLRKLQATEDWSGQANHLSQDHFSWPALERALILTAKPEGQPPAPWSVPPALLLPASTTPGASVIRQRRSAQRMDGATALNRDAFMRMLTRTLPDPSHAPWGSFPWPPRLALFLFVHMVEGVAPGLYAVIRDPHSRDRLKAACNPGFFWREVPDSHAPLHLLAEADLRRTASGLSCRQAIAGKGAFSLSMVADFDRTLTEEGQWAYRRLFWEAGIIGQTLYLEATAAGLSGVGIGCYFDDEVHRLLGLPEGGMEWQSLYHFAVGRALTDERLRSLPAYDHLR
jgi:SagB-type dehydrogenase family enzyme